MVRVPKGNDVKISCVLTGLIADPLIAYCNNCIIICRFYCPILILVKTAKEWKTILKVQIWIKRAKKEKLENFAIFYITILFDIFFNIFVLFTSFVSKFNFLLSRICQGFVVLSDFLCSILHKDRAAQSFAIYINTM